METLIYGMTPIEIKFQKMCEHEWMGHYIDSVSRYSKCKKCFAVVRDITPEEYEKILTKGEVIAARET